MNTYNISRPVRRQWIETEAESLSGEQEYHAPYLHANCKQCEDALLESIDEGVWENEPELMNVIDEAYTDEEGVNFLDVYRHFHLRYQFNHSPYNNRFKAVALPGKRLSGALRTGDIILMRIVLGGKNYQGIITNAQLITNDELNGYDTGSKKPGLFIQAYGGLGNERKEKGYLKIADHNDVIAGNVILLRPRSNKEVLKNDDAGNDISDVYFEDQTSEKGKHNSCEQYFKGTEEEVNSRGLYETYNRKYTDHQGNIVMLEDNENAKDYLLTHFDSDDYNLKPAHYKLIGDLVKYIDDKSQQFDAKGITTKFVIHLQGFASLSNAARPEHNCLLSWMRRKKTKDAFYTTHLSGRLRRIEELGNLRYVMHNHGFFKANKTGDVGEERKVRISIGDEKYVRPPLPSSKNPSEFKVRCIELTDHPFPENDAILLFLKYYADADIEDIITKLLNKITDGSWTKNVDRIKDPVIKKVLKEAAKELLQQLKKRILDIGKVKELIKKWKLDKTYKGAKSLMSALKAILLFINVGMRTGKFEFESTSFHPTQNAKFFFVGIYVEVLLPELPIIGKGIIIPDKESGSAWTSFKTFTINNDNTRSPFEINVKSFDGDAFIGVGTVTEWSLPKKGFLSFHHHNKNFGRRLRNITDGEPINFKLPKDEVTLRFSPSEGKFIII